METKHEHGPWTVVEVTDTPQAAPAETRSTRAEVIDAVREIIHRRLGVDLSGPEALVGLLDNDAVVRLPGVTLNDARTDLVAAEREYEWTGTVTVEVTVEGTVTAQNRVEAAQEARELLSGLGFDIDTYDAEVTDQQHEDYRLWDVSEV